jgi:hypothetical protein
MGYVFVISLQLRERRQKAAESLPELGQDVRRLTNLAYPMAPNDVREILAKEQFIDGLASADMRLRAKSCLAFKGKFPNTPCACPRRDTAGYKPFSVSVQSLILAQTSKWDL